MVQLMSNRRKDAYYYILETQVAKKSWGTQAVADLRTFFTGFLLIDSHYFFPNHTRFSLIFLIFTKPNGFLGIHKSSLDPPLDSS
ncbi:hypothetical protein HanIR_Chr08g0358191 [Helianthus annuus]|nr:hypothetical protein HanIR_Chr08g0358191 [Helianthus annuus]